MLDMHSEGQTLSECISFTDSLFFFCFLITDSKRSQSAHSTGAAFDSISVSKKLFLRLHPEEIALVKMHYPHFPKLI